MAEAVRRLGLRHMVITSVTRDDLPDQGAAHIARCIEAVKLANPATTVEALVQDFGQDLACLATVLEAGPEVFSHNIETVERVFPRLRDRRFSYRSSLRTLRSAADMGAPCIIKSAFMLGCGEAEEDVLGTLQDLLEAGCDAVSIGQYLQPTRRHAAVERFLKPEEFQRYQSLAYDLGFRFAVAGPFVRSSYKSEALLETPFAKERLTRRNQT